MTFTYVVRKGDTIYRIARRNGVSVLSILCSNPHLNEHDYLFPGQVIQVPISGVNKYVAQDGDTVLNIARRFNISQEDLLKLNPKLASGSVECGRTIHVPTGEGRKEMRENIVGTEWPYGPQELADDMLILQGRYARFIECGSIGTSVLGKPIPYLKIGQGSKVVHYNGSFHANEWITSSMLMKFAEQYVKALAANERFRERDSRQMYETTTLWIVPMVNPDGVELVLEGITPAHPYYDSLLQWNRGSLQFRDWKANIRGVDLNDQFPAHWEKEKERRGKKSPGPRDYSGFSPLTEPEAIAIAEFTRAHDFSSVIAFHSQGQEIYWNYRDLEPQHALEMAHRYAKAANYKTVKLADSDAGYKDWFIHEFRRPGFTVEVGIGINPLPLERFSLYYEGAVEIMLEGLFPGQ